MPELRLPLVGSFNPRGPFKAYTTTITTGKDQLFQNCEFDVVKNPVTGAGNVYCSKLWYSWNLYTAGDGTYDYGLEVISSDFGGQTWVVSAFGSDNRIDQAVGSKIFIMRPGTVANTSMGITTGGITHLVETVISGVQMFLFTSYDGTGWFLAKDSITTNDTSINVAATFTANTTSGNVVLSNVSSFAGRYVGQALSGTGIAAGARILSMDTGASTITMTANATATGTGVTVTAERIAKIIDADFPTDIIGPFACIDGYNLIHTESNRLYNSNLNSIVSWTSGDYIETNFYPDNAKGGAWVVSNKIAVISSGSFEWYYNAGNPSGSPLSRSPELNFPIGAINSRCICNFDGTLIWVSSISSGSPTVYILNGYSPKEISTPQLNAIIGSPVSSGSFNPVATTIRLGGKKYLIISGVFALDMDNFIWVYWGVSNKIPMRASGVFNSLGTGLASTLNTIYSVNSSSSGISQISTDIATSVDGGNPLGGNMILRTARLDFGTGNRKSVQYYELDSDVQSSGTATLEVSDDDFQTWTTIGTFDMTKVNPRIYRGGSWKGGRAHRITHSASTPFRASTLTIRYEVGQH